MFIWPGLVTPFILLVVGILYFRYPPKMANPFSGYRTARAVKSAESWKEANRFAAKLTILFSLAAMVIMTGISLLFGDKGSGVAATVLISPLLCVIAMILVVVCTERHLKKMFG